jgi:hypothetical protein
MSMMVAALQRSKLNAGKAEFAALAAEKTLEIITFCELHFAADCCFSETALVAESRYVFARIWIAWGGHC